MKQEDKELLLKDLCARLPYGVKIALKNSEAYHHNNIAKRGDVTIDRLKGFNGSYFSIYHDDPLDWDWYVSDIDIKDIKPYLFPLSSMTEEQKYELQKIIYVETEMICNQLKMNNYGIEAGKYHFNSTLQVDWLNKNHFDYRGLIEKGLAIDCTNLNIY